MCATFFTRTANIAETLHRSRENGPRLSTQPCTHAAISRLFLKLILASTQRFRHGRTSNDSVWLHLRLVPPCAVSGDFKVSPAQLRYPEPLAGPLPRQPARSRRCRCKTWHCTRRSWPPSRPLRPGSPKMRPLARRIRLLESKSPTQSSSRSLSGGHYHWSS